MYLDENGELAADLDIVNWVKFSNGSIVRVQFGSIGRQGSSEPQFNIDEDAMVWLKWLNQVGGKKSFHVTPLTFTYHIITVRLSLKFFRSSDLFLLLIWPFQVPYNALCFMNKTVSNN